MPKRDLDVGDFPHRGRSVINVLPDGVVGERGHRLIEVAARERSDDGQHLNAGKAHVSATVQGCLGESRNADLRYLRLHATDRIVRRRLLQA